MKGNRLVDVLDEPLVDNLFWDKMFAKMNMLLIAIENTNPSIDDKELRWVSDRIEYWNTNDRILEKNEMLTANLYWKKFGGPHNVVRNG